MLLMSTMTMLLPASLRAQWCGTTVDEAALRLNEATRADLQRFPQPTFDPRSVDVIRIQPHVITRFDGSGAFPQEELDRELQQLNAFYQDMNVQFEMCEPNLIRNDGLYDFNSRDERTFIALAKPNVINVFFPRTASIGDNEVCGYAYFPNSSKRLVVVASECATDGAVLAHEIGHYFFLFHTHGKSNNRTTDEFVDGSNCTFAGDDLCDTPADPNLTDKVGAGCQYVGGERDAKGQLFNPSVGNIMSYAPSSCQSFFTPQQFQRMRFYLENGREELFEPSEDCEVFSLETCEFDVTSTEDSGPGSLRYALRCANLNPGPDTIRFRLPAQTLHTIEVNSTFPRIRDEGTVIDARTDNGAQVVLDASGIELLGNQVFLFNVDANGFELYGLTIQNLLRLEVQASQAVAAIAIDDFADDFRIGFNRIESNLVGLRIGRAYGRVHDNFIDKNAYGMFFASRANGIAFQGNTFTCNAEGALFISDASSESSFPDPPQISTVNQQFVRGTAPAGAEVDVFEVDDSDCVFTLCQGNYLGTATADASGKWELASNNRLLGQYNATLTLTQGGRAYTSTFSDCVRGVAERVLWAYPNPSSGLLFLEVEGETANPFQVELLDLMGRTIRSWQLEKPDEYLRTELNLRDLAGGHYLMRTQVNGSTVIQRIMVQ